MVDWAVGDTLVVAPSSFHASEAEQAVIKSIRGSVVKLENKLDFEHYGAARPAVVGGKQVRAQHASQSAFFWMLAAGHATPVLCTCNASSH